MDDSARSGDITPLYEAIMEHVAPRTVDQDGPFQMRISQLDYNNFVGLIGVGRIQRGKVPTHIPGSVIHIPVTTHQCQVLQVLRFNRLERQEGTESATCDIASN